MTQSVHFETYTPEEPSRPRDPRFRAMTVSGCLAVGLCAAAVLLPSPYVIESPGPTFNTIGEINGQPLIHVEGRESFPPQGELDLTTVYVSGGPNGQVNVLDTFRAWVDPDENVRPEQLVYPEGTTSSDVAEQNAVAMTSSQESAIAAALSHEDIAYTEELSVAGLAADSASDGVLEEGDVLRAVDGKEIENIETLRSALRDAEGAPATLSIVRDGVEDEVSVTPRQSEEGNYQLGILLASTFDFPFDVTIQLDNVGGPSAGMMFALGIIDTLTEGDLTGGRHFAGTGTIDSTGAVGRIGGIAQKLVAARAGGADFFLAPEGNCDEVVGHIPDGLTVVKVATLDEAFDSVEALGAGGDPAELPSC
ncbi:YlbL family protein [Arthrobacter burdickii]|uniref:endopeptidase La n=1 Tax=Arthrobacter burdickii TaxID=3035920 RepID=A0ABT8K0Q8_9MICC|nr:S16 family serine protease [Arthrobacter burdickii]MDN4611001.1 S16 family serine protease [Arthrobacter burdickii]